MPTKAFISDIAFAALVVMQNSLLKRKKATGQVIAMILIVVLLVGRNVGIGNAVGIVEALVGKF